MTTTHIRSLVLQYLKDLEAHVGPQTREALRHAYMLCHDMWEKLNAGEYDEAFRLLGFVQAIFVAEGFYRYVDVLRLNKAPAEQEAALTETVKQLCHHLESAAFPASDVEISSEDDELIVTIKKSGGILRRHRLQIREVRETASPDAA